MQKTVTNLHDPGMGVDPVLNEIRQLAWLADYASRGRIVFALDTSEILDFFLPVVTNQIFGSGSLRNNRLFFMRQVALAFLFGREILFSEAGPAPFLLLPPYEEELGDVLTSIASRLDFSEFLKGHSPEGVRDLLYDFLDLRDVNFSDIAGKISDGLPLLSDEKTLVLNTLKDKYVDFMYGLRFAGSDLVEEIGDMRAFLADQTRCVNWEAFRKRTAGGRLCACPRKLLSEMGEVWFGPIHKARGRNPRYITNSLRDSLAIEYVLWLNALLYPDMLVILVTRSNAMSALSEKIKLGVHVFPDQMDAEARKEAEAQRGLGYQFDQREQPCSTMGVPVEGYHPSLLLTLDTISFYMSLAILDPDTTRVDVGRTRRRLRSLSDAADKVERNRKSASQSGYETQSGRGAFVSGATEAALVDLSNAVTQRVSPQLALRAVPLIRKYADRVPDAAERVASAQMHSIEQFLGILAGSRVHEAAMLEEVDQLRQELRRINRDLAAISHLGHLDLRHISHRSIKGYWPRFRSREIENLFKNVVEHVKNDPAKVFEDLSQAYVRFRGHHEINILAAYIFLKHGNSESALAELSKAYASTDGGNPDVCFLLALVLRIERRFSEAYKIITNEITTDDDYLKPYILRELSLLTYRLAPNKVCQSIALNKEAIAAASVGREHSEVMPWLHNNDAYLHAKAFQVLSSVEMLASARASLRSLRKIVHEDLWIPHFLHTSCLVNTLEAEVMRVRDKAGVCERLSRAVIQGDMAVQADEAGQPEFVDDLRRAAHLFLEESCADQFPEVIPIASRAKDT